MRGSIEEDEEDEEVRGTTGEDAEKDDKVRLGWQWCCYSSGPLFSSLSNSPV